MRKLFGTDGIRGKAGEHPLDEETVCRLGLALGRKFSRTQEALNTAIRGIRGLYFFFWIRSGLQP